MTKPLSPAQRELLEAMQRGVRVMHPRAFHYVRDDSSMCVSATAIALVNKGLAELLPPYRELTLTPFRQRP